MSTHLFHALSRKEMGRRREGERIGKEKRKDGKRNGWKGEGGQGRKRR